METACGRIRTGGELGIWDCRDGEAAGLFADPPGLGTTTSGQGKRAPPGPSSANSGQGRAWRPPARAGRGGLRPGRARRRSVGHELRQGPIWRPLARACGAGRPRAPPGPSAATSGQGGSALPSSAAVRGHSAMSPAMLRREILALQALQREITLWQHHCGDLPPAPGPERRRRLGWPTSRNRGRRRAEIGVAAYPYLKRDAGRSSPRFVQAAIGVAGKLKVAAYPHLPCDARRSSPCLADEHKSGSPPTPTFCATGPCASFSHFLVRFAGGLAGGDEVVASRGAAGGSPRQHTAPASRISSFTRIFFFLYFLYVINLEGALCCKKYIFWSFLQNETSVRLVFAMWT
jgi:hypothetical protein